MNMQSDRYIKSLRKNQLHEKCVKFIKKIHGNIADYKIFVTFALKYEKMNNY